MFGQKKIPSRDGGAEVVVGNLSARLVKSGHIVTCFNRSTGHDDPKRSEFEGIELRTVYTVKKRGLSAAIGAFKAAWLAATGDYDVVHIHSEGPAAMSWLPKLAGKKVIVTIHGLDHKRRKWGRPASLCLKTGERIAARCADGIIVLSRNMQRYFKTVYGRDTVFIPNGVDRYTRTAPKEIKERWGLEKDGYVLFLGRLVPEKGLELLLKAWKSIDSAKKLVIAGASSDTDDFVREIRGSAGEDVIFTGFADGQILSELYSNAYLYVLPSELEGMPLTLLEAMSFGNCCLVSDIPECSEVVEDMGVTFRCGDAEDLAEKMQQLLDDPETVAYMRDRSSDFICNKCSWDTMTAKTLEVYRSE